MTTSQKAALSLLISVILFGAFTALAFTGLFDLVEARFYDPSVTASLTRSITGNADAVDAYLAELQDRFSLTLKEPAVLRSFLPNQSAEDIFERSRIYGLMAESSAGFQWVRFIDSGGSRLHYSSHEPDILQQDRLSVSYRNYSEPDFPYGTVAVADGGAPAVFLDGNLDRLLFSFPFYDSFDVYRGTALFSVSAESIMDMLVNEGRIRAGRSMAVVPDPPGFFSGASPVLERTLAPRVAALWKEGGVKTAWLDSQDSGAALALISVKAPRSGFFIGRLVDGEIFPFPRAMKIILLASFFLTVYLTSFLLFNLRQDSVTIVQNRLKQLQISLIEQYYEHKGDVDWSHWSRELEQRRDEISAQLKRGIKTGSGSKDAGIDALISKSWDGLVPVMESRKDPGIDGEKLQAMLDRILAALPKTGAPARIEAQPPSAETAELLEEAAAEETGALEELGTEEEPEALEAGDAEPAELLEEASAEDAGALEELGTEEEPEVLEDADETEPAETAELLEEAPAEEDGTLEELAAGEEPEALESAGDAEPAELAAAGEAGALEELGVEEEPEVLEDAEPAELLEEAGSPGELDGAEKPEKAPFAGSSGPTIEEIASRIEFSSDIEEDIPGNDTFRDDFEVISPFSTIFSGLDEDESGAFPEDGDALDGNGEGSLPPRGSPEQDSGGGAAVEDPVTASAPDAWASPAAGDLPETRLSPEETPEAFSGFAGAEPLSPAGGNADGAEARMDAPYALLDEDPDAAQGLSLFRKPFSGLPGGAVEDDGIETLEALPGRADEEEAEELAAEEVGASDSDGIIEEREGVHYISGGAFSPKPEDTLNLNPDLKNLVDSIIK